MPAEAALLSVLGAPAGERLRPLPATMVVGAHPDDETVGAGSRLPRLAAARFLCVTDGAPRNGEDASRHGFTPEEYARARRLELQTVLVRCGIAPSRLASLEAPDQQAPLLLAPLARTLADRLAEEGTEVILTHAYEGGHPDHDATAFIVHAAVALLRARRERFPGIVEMASYHRAPDGVRTFGFLPRADGEEDHAVTVALTPEEQRFKADLIASFATQRQTLESFPVDREGFRPAPRYDFRQPPHAGKLHYEHYPWGMSGDHFRALVAEAMSELGLAGLL
nr:PIG-L family deacetylase [Ramlibacter cellulosilyticus]